MENFSQSVKSDYLKKLKSEQISVDCIMNVPEDKLIGEILGKSASVQDISAERSQNFANLSGKVSFKLIYKTVDNVLFALDYFSSFKSDIKLDVECEKLLTFGKVVNVEVLSQKEREVKLKAIVEVDLIGIVQTEYKAVDNNSLCRKTSEVSQTCLKDIATGTFDIYEEFESGANIENILLLDSDLVLSSSKTGRDSLLVSGTATTSIVYSSDKGVINKTFSLPFCEELKQTDAHPDDEVHLFGSIKESRIVLSGDEDNTTIRVEVTVNLTCPVFECEQIETLVDAFDTEREVTYTKKECNVCKKTGEWSFEERLSGSAKLGDDTPYIDRIITTAMTGSVPSSVKTEKDKIMVEGVALTTVIYEDVEGNIRSIEVELPYALNLKADGAKECSEVYIKSAVCDVTAALKKKREIEIMYLLRIYASSSECDRFDLIDSLTVLDGKQTDMPALVMYMTNSSSDDFEIAKSLKVRPENVIRGEDKDFVLCFRQLDV